jgi:RHS repeat-associated protein
MFGLINMNARLYDPAIGRFLAPDPHVPDGSNSLDYNRYMYARNNPLVYSDPSGEKWWHWALGLALFDPVSAITTGLAAAGTASASALTTASVAAGTVTGTLSAVYAANYPFSNENYEIQKIFSPVAFKPSYNFGSIQNDIGFDVSVGFSKSGRLHYGASYYWSDYGGYNGWGQRKGYEFALAPNVSYSVTDFSAGQYSQTTGKITLGNPWTNISYENDYMFGLPGADGGDRWRTAAVGMNFGPLSLNLNMFTGDPGKDIAFRQSEYLTVYDKNGKPHKAYSQLDANNPNQRAGVLTFGIGPIRIGRNSEQIRHVFQNRFAHDMLTGGKSYWFMKLPISPSWYWSIGSGHGNTLW